MKKGYFSIDMVVSLVIFLLIISISFYYLSYLSRPAEPITSTLKTASFDFAERIEENIRWSVYMMPIFIESDHDSKIVIEKKFYPESNIDLNSIIIEDENLSEINSSFEDNTIIFTPTIKTGKNNYYLVYTKNTALDAREYTTDLNAAGTWINNSLMNISFATTGISQTEFNGVSILQGIGTDFTTSSVPNLDLSAVRAKRAYDNGINVKIYNNNSKIIVTSNHTFSPIIYVTKAFTNYYNGSTNSIASSGLQFNSIIDFIDVYGGGEGIAVIGNSLNVSFYNNTYNEIRLYNVTEFEMYFHEGTYTNALLEKDMYLNPPDIILLMPEEVSGISLGSLLELGNVDYNTIKDSFAKGLDFNITLYNTSIGIERPIDITVITIKYPVMIVDRFAKSNRTELDIAVMVG
ncbi:MAG: hypothetical protein KAI53_03690 [Candidatus Aenigmarchaeota archaeon]|nr:hypothetical protein [Candidatus Aenigmarchaeota archaeon]